jgi:3-oxoacyl-[acyl-carrier-protein] synthase-3
MFNRPVGIRSLAVSLPSAVRTNDYWQNNYPELVEQAEQLSLAKALTPEGSTANEINPWIEEMMPYLSDPFRGSVERRVLDTEEDAHALVYRAAREALETANLTAKEIDLAMVNVIWPEQILTGDAAFFAGKLGLKCQAWNINSGCSSAMDALQTAYVLVRSGEYRNVLVITSAAYTNFSAPNDTMSFIVGDAASAFVVSELNPGQGILGSKIFNASQTWGGFHPHIFVNDRGKVQVQMQPTDNASAFQKVQNKYFYTCCEGAAAAAGVTLDQIDFFTFFTPAAWFVKACTRALGIDFARTIDLYPYLGNIGPVLSPIYLYFAAQAGRIHENDLVLLYAIGYCGNAGAIVMRWGDVALGPLPENSEKILDAARGKVPMATAT